MKLKHAPVVAVYLLVALSPPTPALQGLTTELTLDELYSKQAFQQRGIGQVRWMKDNVGYSTLEGVPGKRGREIIRYDARSGGRTVLVTLEQLTLARAAGPEFEQTVLTQPRRSVWLNLEASFQ